MFMNGTRLSVSENTVILCQLNFLTKIPLRWDDSKE